MNLEKILSLIETEETKLALTLSEDRLDLKKIEKVITENNFTTVKGLLNINTVDVITAYLCINSNKYNFDEIHTRIEKNMDLTKPHAKMLQENLIDLLSNRITSFLLEKLLKDMTDDFKQFDYNSLKELYLDNAVDLHNVFVIMSVIEEIKRFNEQLKDYTEKIEARVKYKNKAIEETLKDKYNFDKLTEELQKIINYYQKIKKKDKEEKRQLKLELANYKTAKNLLLKGKVKDIDKLLSLIKNDEIKKEILYQINNIKKEEFSSLYEEYSKLSNNNKLEVQALFKDYDFDFNGLSSENVNKILLIENNVLKLLLEKIKLLNIVDIKLVEYILLNSSCDILDHIIYLIKDNIITLEFVIDNISILSIKDNRNSNYPKLVEMLELFKNEGINSRLFVTDLELYLYDVNIIKNNIYILKKYNLLSSLKTSETFDFLKDNNLNKKIDILLELGYEKLLEENLSLLNRNINQIEKLYILKNMTLLPVDMESLIKVLDDDKFLAFVDNPYNYIYNAVDNHVDKNLLNEVKMNSFDNEQVIDNTTSRVINISGILFSRNRIRNNLKILNKFDLSDEERQINSFLIGSVLSQEEYDTLISELKEKRKIFSI